MTIKQLALTAAVAATPIFLSCQDDLSSQGASLVTGEVTISVDSLEHDIPSRSVAYQGYDARSTTKLLGRINVPEYGSLKCSYLSQLYPSPQLGIPDSITAADIDSMRMIVRVPRGSLTGDSLAPQQLKVYRLNRQIPADIANNADPADFCDMSDPDALMGTKSYTLSSIASSDSIFLKQPEIRIPIRLSDKTALDVFNQYKSDPSLFEWPETFAQKFPGVYVEQNFGNGCIANVFGMDFYLYWKHKVASSVKNEETGNYETAWVTKRDSICVFATSPEVTSTNIIDYKVSDYISSMVNNGKAVMTTPGGYYSEITFPADKIIQKYKEHATPLTVVSNLSLVIPAEVIKNDYGLETPPYMLMVKSSEREEFFQNNRLPDQVNSFYAPYDAATKSYSFNTLRQYILQLIEAGEVTADDMEFSLVPVDIKTESVDSYYGTNVYVTRCSNYMTKPTMTLLHTDKAIICFTYSKQEIE